MILTGGILMKHTKKGILILTFSIVTVLGLKIISNSITNKVKIEADRKIASVFEKSKNEVSNETKELQEDVKEFGSGAGRAFFVIHPFKLDLEYALHIERTKTMQTRGRNLASEKNLPQINVFKHWGLFVVEDKYFVN